MSNVINYINNLLSDGKGSPSSKRVITFLFTFMYIVIAGFGFTGVEKFAPNRLTDTTSAP